MILYAEGWIVSYTKAELCSAFFLTKIIKTNEISQ